MDSNLTVDHCNECYSFCIVWTPIPIVTWILPLFGHVGIATSRGMVHDFTCSYKVCENNMMFGVPTKYCQLRYHLACGWQNGWDNAIMEAGTEYSSRKYRLCSDNCYSHVAMALNVMKYDGCTNWNMAKLVSLTIFKSKYVSKKSMVKTWMPFIIIIGIISLIIFMVYDSVQST